MTDGERLARMERMIEAIAERLCIELDDASAGLTARDATGYIDRTALDRAIRDLARGNRGTLERYLRRGGKIPKGGDHENESC